MSSSTVFDGKVYVFRVKGTANKNWDQPDVIFGIAHEGLDGLTFTKFGKMALDQNKKLFLSKKANRASDGCCTWDEIASGLDDWSKIGDPKFIFVEKPITWYALARIAYQNLIFTNESGIDTLDAIAEKKEKAVDKTLMIMGPYKKAAVMIQDTISTSKELAQYQSSSFASNLSQGAKYLTGLAGSTVDWYKLAKDELVNMLDEYKARAIESEARSEALEEKVKSLDKLVSLRDGAVAELETKLKAVKIELDASKKAQAGFMAATDKHSLQPNAVIEALKPFLKAQLAPFKTSLESSVSMMGGLKTSCDNIPLVKQSVLDLASSVPKAFAMLTSQCEANFECSQEGFATVESTMDNFGLSSEASPFNLPQSLFFIEQTVKTNEIGAKKPAEPVHDGPCAYKLVVGQPGALQCTLGCTKLLHTTTGAGSSGSLHFNPTQFLTPPPSFTPKKDHARTQGVQDGGVMKKLHQRNKKKKKSNIQLNKAIPTVESLQQQFDQIKQNQLQQQQLQQQ